MIRKQTIIDIFEETGFTDYMIISERLFRVTIAERKHSFVEIVNDDVAYNSQIIGKPADLKTLLLDIKNEQTPRKRRKTATANDVDED